MTGPDADRLLAVLAATSHVLLDFDGPVCDVFAGYPAPQVAQRMRQAARTAGLALPDDVLATDDPLQLLRRVGDVAAPVLPDVEAALDAAELLAVATAAPTPGAAEFLAACRAADRPVAIVSNNGGAAVRAYLARHGLADRVRHVRGRHPLAPRRLKPAPDPLLGALAALGATPGDAVLVGDSRADVDAARAAGVRVIAYANKPPKLRALADADAVVTAMTTLADALRS